MREARSYRIGGVGVRRWGGAPLEAAFLHGALLSASAWDAVVSPAEWNAIALDLPGHGDSQWYEDGDYALDRVADDIAAALRNETDGSIVLVGHSRGGLVAARIAARSPDLVAHLVLVDVDPSASPSAGWPTPRRHEGTLEELAEDIQRLRPDLSRDRVVDGVRRGAREHAEGRWAWRWDPRGSGTTSPDERDRGRRSLSRIRADVHVIWGTTSSAVTEEGLVRLESIVGRTVGTLALPSGHNPHSETPDQLRSALEPIIRPSNVARW